MCQNLNTWGGFWMEQEAGTDEGEYCEKVRSLPNDRGLQLQCARHCLCLFSYTVKKTMIRRRGEV